MPGSPPAAIEPSAAGAARPAREPSARLLYALCGSLALYPLLEKFIAPVVLVSYVLVASAVVLRLLGNGLRLPRTMLWTVWSIYLLVYATWFGIGLLHGNHVPYIAKDSQGFLLYLAVMPVLFLYIRFGALESRLPQFVIACGVVIAALSLVVVALYHVVFGEIDADSLLLVNAGIASVGLAWKIDHNAGVLGVYTNTGHLLLLAIAVVLYRYSQAHRKRDLALAALFLVGIVLDGRRALVIAVAMQLIILAPRLFERMSASRKMLLASLLVVVPAVAVLLNLDWLAARFAFSEDDPSTAERFAQIPALLDKIAQNPVLGSGFGSVAAYIRSIERPFSYEMDYLATAMKLGLAGSLVYFGTYLASVAYGWRRCGRAGVFLLSAGLPFFFFMGTNGDHAMSTDSAVFHILLLLLIATSARRPGAPRAAAAVLHPAS